MAQAFNPNGFTVNGMGVPVQARPVPTEEQALRDTLDVLRNSLLMMEGEPDLAAECAEVRASIRAIEEHLSMSREAERVLIADAIPAGKCPICGQDRAEFPHSEWDCMEWFAEDYADQADTIATLRQF